MSRDSFLVYRKAQAVRVPRLLAVFAREPALSEAEGVGV
jgi:hypothetical protein